MLSDKELELLNRIQKKAVYEDKFFEKRSEFKWFNELKRRGYFNPNLDTQPYESKEKGYYSIPQWNILSYLERVSQRISIPGNEIYTDEILAIIKNVSNYKDSKGQHIDNYRTWYYFVKILLNLPNDKIPLDMISLIPIWLDSKFSTMLQGSEIATKLLPKFLTDDPEDIKRAEKIIESITAIKTVPISEERVEILGKKEEAILVVDSHWLKEAFKKHSGAIGEKCTVKVIDDLVKKVKSLLKREDDETYHSFYEEREHNITDPVEILTFILKRILFVKAKKDVDATKEILRDFLNDKYFYFPKMAIYVMGQNTDNYSDLFWEILDTGIGDLIMEKTLYLGDEVEHLLRNIKDLDSHKETLKLKIEKAAERVAPQEEREKYIALHKQAIYEALSHDEDFRNLYEEMKEITNIDAALHPAIGKVETSWGPGPSPFTKEQILKMPNEKLAEYLSTFKTKDAWKGPTVGGLAELLSGTAKEAPEKFIKDLSPFKDTGFIYVYEILKGIKDAWNGKKILDWTKLFEFIESYMDRKGFWEDKFIVKEGDWLGGADHEWIAGVVAELIQDGTRDDSWAFPEEHFEKAEKIIFLILDKLEPEEDKEITDYVTYTLNTPLGKTLTALILLALRIARVNAQKGVSGEVKWIDEYKEKFERMLNRKYKEGFVNLGRYLPNLYYLDKGWVKKKIKHLEDEKGSKYWEAFMDGYLSIGRVYDELYGLMRAHYQYGVEYDFKEKRDDEHLVQHIALGYLRKQESLSEKGSLFKQILDKFEYDQIEDIIGFFWIQRRYLGEQTETDEDLRKRIIEFWRWLYEKYIENAILTEQDKKILSNIAKLAPILPQIDEENFKWLMLSAPYVHVNFNSTFFIEYLDEVKDKGDSEETAKYIGEIFLKMLEKFTPDHDEKHIRSIVEFLCRSNNTKNAQKICKFYGQRGYEFLREIYDKCLDKQ